jgi:alkaline phosphatase D
MALRSLRRALLAVRILTSFTPAARAEVVFDGVAAGDVSNTDAILWTRADNDGSTTNLTAQVATDQGFANIVVTLGGTTRADSDFTLRLLASALATNTRYYYRFLAPSGVVSPTGQFVTAPAPNQRAA